MLPDEAFIEQVRDLLPHLEDRSYYHVHPLLEQVVPPHVVGTQERARTLRTIIRTCIADMRPDRDAALRSPKARGYAALSLRYLDGFTIQEAAGELAVSERQYYRDLREAEQDLAALLWARVVRQSKTARRTPEGLSPAELVRREADRLPVEAQEISIQALVRDALASVQRLSDQFGLCIHVDMPAEPLPILTDRMLAKQALINTLSHVLQSARPGSALQVLACRQGDRAEVDIRYAPDEPIGRLRKWAVPAAELVARLGGAWSVESVADGQVSIKLVLGELNQITLLVIDDNAGLIELFQRYAVDASHAAAGLGAVRVIGAQDSREGLRLAETLTPDVIVLDVMMPQQDGWDVLAQLRDQASTQQIPVIVCSVLNDPQLALSLGATAFLAKPVSRQQLLAALASFRQDRTSR